MCKVEKPQGENRKEKDSDLSYKATLSSVQLRHRRCEGGFDLQEQITVTVFWDFRDRWSAVGDNSYIQAANVSTPTGREG